MEEKTKPLLSKIDFEDMVRCYNDLNRICSKNECEDCPINYWLEDEQSCPIDGLHSVLNSMWKKINEYFFNNQEGLRNG